MRGKEVFSEVLEESWAFDGSKDIEQKIAQVERNDIPNARSKVSDLVIAAYKLKKKYAKSDHRLVTRIDNLIKKLEEIEAQLHNVRKNLKKSVSVLY
jgi:division protein CdvB (Snf7/Vps24/ESCRT-III family)